MDIRNYLDTNRLLMDGAMGTYFLSRQEQGGCMPELALKDDGKEIQKIHKAYCRAGARLIKTDTFAANKFSLGMGEIEADEILKLAVRAAENTAGAEVFVAGDIGPVPEHAMREEQEILAEYQRMCRGLLKEGISIILFETFSRLDHMEFITEWLRKEAPDCFIMAQFILNKNGYTPEGISASRIIRLIAEKGFADSVGFNCGIGSGHMEAVLKHLDLTPLLTSQRTKYLSIAPNASYPEQQQSRMQFMDNIAYFSEHMAGIAAMGVDILGSCCGTTPEYTRRMKQEIDWNISYQERTEMKKQKAGAFFVSSESEKEIKQKEQKKDRETFLEKLKQGKKVLAVELDPPYDADCSRILACGRVLKQCGIDIITMADSPMGRSRVDSVLMGIRMAEETGMDIMPHVCCRDKNMIAMRSCLMGAYINHIRNLLVVTGDPVPGTQRGNATGVFDYNSIRLMQRIREMNLEHFAEDPIVYGGALNYGRGLLDNIAKRMEQKVEAGASYFLTQPVFSDGDIERIAWLKERIDTKILCGIMPLVSYKNAKFMQNEIAGVHVPDEIVNRYDLEMTREEGEAKAVALVEELTEKMASLADGFYFMLPFNRVSIIEKYREKYRVVI